MTIDELIKALEAIRESLGSGDGQVIIRSQPNWPLTELIISVVSNRDIAESAQWDSDRHDDSAPADFMIKGSTDLDVWIAVDQPDSFSDLAPYAPSHNW